MNTAQIKDEIEDLKEDLKKVDAERRKLSYPDRMDFSCDKCGAAAGLECKTKKKRDQHLRSSAEYDKAQDKHRRIQETLQDEYYRVRNELETKCKELDDAEKEMWLKAVEEEAQSPSNKTRSVVFLRAGREELFEVVEAKNFFQLKAGDRVNRKVVDLFNGTSVEVETVREFAPKTTRYALPWGFR